jgi:hypothetical protein
MDNIKEKLFVIIAPCEAGSLVRCKTDFMMYFVKNKSRMSSLLLVNFSGEQVDLKPYQEGIRRRNFQDRPQVLFHSGADERKGN